MLPAFIMRAPCLVAGKIMMNQTHERSGRSRFEGDFDERRPCGNAHMVALVAPGERDLMVRRNLNVLPACNLNAARRHAVDSTRLRIYLYLYAHPPPHEIPFGQETIDLLRFGIDEDLVDERIVIGHDAGAPLPLPPRT